MEQNNMISAEDAFNRILANDSDPHLVDIVATDPYYAVQYALEVLRGRWLRAEPVIATDPLSAFLYARDLLNNRWPLGEPAIVSVKDLKDEYEDEFDCDTSIPLLVEPEYNINPDDWDN